MRFLTGNRNHRFSDKEHKGYLARQKAKRKIESKNRADARTVSKYKGIKLICGWAERDGREAFIIPCLGDKIIWIPVELVYHESKYKHIIHPRADLDQYFEEAGYPVEHIHLLQQMKKNKKEKVA